MCRYKESHIHGWVDWVAFSTELPECDRTFSRSVSLRDLKVGRLDIKKVLNGIPNVTKMGSMICHRIF